MPLHHFDSDTLAGCANRFGGIECSDVDPLLELFYIFIFVCLNERSEKTSDANVAATRSENRNPQPQLCPKKGAVTSQRVQTSRL